MKWTKEACLASAAKYDTRSEWQKADQAAYVSAKRHGWHEACCAHMQLKKRPAGHWTRESCKTSAAAHNCVIEWQKAAKSAYEAARTRGWLDECTAHMHPAVMPWTVGRCKTDAAKYRTRAEWASRSANAYQAAHRNGWLDECCAHMQRLQKENGYWDVVRCANDALKFTSRTEWARHSTAAYSAAQRLGVLDSCCAHMDQKIKPAGYWTLEKCKADAARYRSRSQWCDGSPGGYAAAGRKGWLDECTAHMERIGGTDADIIYVWAAEGETFNGKQVYKIGVTSSRCSYDRMAKAAAKNSMTPRLVVSRWVGYRQAETLEAHLLTFGEDPKLDVPDGRTEFRALDDGELATILDLIHAHPFVL